MSKREPRLLIQDILESIEKIRLYTKNYDLGAFESDNKTIDAVIRNLEIIGEAANKLPQDIKKKRAFAKLYHVMLNLFQHLLQWRVSSC